jgi:Ser/Thr protein kinase RdoA (MazF antagonist)
MTKSDVAIATASRSMIYQQPVPNGGFERLRAYEEQRELRAELDRLEPLVSAAMLTATAFRLRDHEALTEALRMLVSATRLVEREEAFA